MRLLFIYYSPMMGLGIDHAGQFIMGISHKFGIIFIPVLWLCCAPNSTSSRHTPAEPNQESTNETGAKVEENNPSTPSSNSYQDTPENPFFFPGNELDDTDLPAISIAIPSLKKDKILSFSPDSNHIVNVVGFAGAFEDEIMDGDHQFVVMTSDVTPAQAGGQFFQSLSPPTAHAAVSAKTPAESICQQANVSCCPIVEAGDTVCPHQLTDLTPSQLYLAIMDQSGTLSKTSPEIIQENILFTKGTPLASSVSDQQAKLYTLTKNGAVKIQPVIPAAGQQEAKQQWQVSGNHQDNYLDFPASGGQLSFDSTHDLFGVLNKSTGIRLHEMDQFTENVTDTGFTATQPGAAGYTGIKYVNGGMYYGIESLKMNNGTINFALENSPYDPDFETNEDILFLKYKVDQDVNNKPMTFKKTITFDIDSSGYALVVYEDWEGQTKIRMGHKNNNSKFRFGGEIPMTNISEFRDVRIYHANSASTDYGKALLLDSLNNRLWVIEFNYMLGAAREIKIEKFIELGPDKSPVGMTLNDEKSIVCVLNRGDETITVLSLNNENGSVKKLPTITKTIKLSGLIKDKTLTLKPNGIHYLDGQLFVSSEGLRGELIIPLAEE